MSFGRQSGTCLRDSCVCTQNEKGMQGIDSRVRNTRIKGEARGYPLRIQRDTAQRQQRI
jgi:hypothetical protein